MTSEVRVVRVEAAGAVLAGTLSRPPGEDPVPVVVVAHGASEGTRDGALYVHLRWPR